VAGTNNDPNRKREIVIARLLPFLLPFLLPLQGIAVWR
jgi:hypothetical protein